MLRWPEGVIRSFEEMEGFAWPGQEDLRLDHVERAIEHLPELKREYGDRLCLTGNIELDRLSRGTPEEVRRMVRRNIEELGFDGGYCVGSSNSVTHYVPLENFVAMIEEGLRG